VISAFRSSLLAIPVFIAALLAGCSDPPPPEVKVVIGAAARVNGVLMDRTALVIENDILKAAGAQADVPIPAGSNKTDLTGRFIEQVPEPGMPATFTVLVCNPEGEPSCRQKALRHMKAGSWVD
jgi:hypothetical protein